MKQIYTNIIFLIASAISISGCNNDKDSDTVPGNGTVNTQGNSNTAFVVNGGDASISAINMSNNTVQKTIPLTNADFPHHISLSPDKSKMLVGVPGMDFSGGHDMGGMTMAMPGKVIVLDANNGNIIHTINTNNMNHNAVFSPDGTEIWTGQMSMEGSVLIFDASNYHLKDSIPAEMYSAEVTFSHDGKKAFVANEGSANITVIDVATKKAVKTIDVGNGPVGAWTGSDNKMYVDNEESQTLSIIDVAGLAVVETVNLGFTPGMAAYNGTTMELWVSDGNAGRVHYFQRENGAWTDKGSIPTGAGAHAIAFNSAGTKAYVTNQLGGSVSVIDVAMKTKITDVIVGNKPNGIALKD